MVNVPKSARAEVLAKVRARLGVRGDEPGRRGLAQERLRNPKANLIPERAQKPRAELIKLFQAMLEKSGAKVTRVRALKALPEAIAAQLRENNLPDAPPPWRRSGFRRLKGRARHVGAACGAG